MIELKVGQYWQYECGIYKIIEINDYIKDLKVTGEGMVGVDYNYPKHEYIEIIKDNEPELLKGYNTPLYKAINEG